ncbi:unnamed protein product (mitochondrion) [Plasmodiophora brassicae]|uniref:Cation-transporting P-type ATPase N-terminal domain-containing protein n=1 Tax=Plasmodiophora brassicae TaxID=37360 RepID=A0A3P3YB29_PLABS|nr:unnamed protein product [Plasmodiophora brassicae]
MRDDEASAHEAQRQPEQHVSIPFGHDSRRQASMRFDASSRVLRAPTSPSERNTVENMESIVVFRTMSTTHALDLAAKVKLQAGGHGKHEDPAAAIRQITVHQLTPDQAIDTLDTNRTTGLTSSQVTALAKRGRVNRITPAKSNWIRKGLGYVFGGFNSLMWIAMIVTILSYYPLGEPDPQIFNLGVAVLIGLVIVVSTVFYAAVDYNASQVMKAIKTLVSESATVVRDGAKIEINADNLLPGDVVHLSLGQRVPADLRLLEVSPDLRFDRSLLTGESEPIPGSVSMTDANPLETQNLALSSTFVVQGSAVGVVFAIGDETVIGRIFHLSTKPKTQSTALQADINRFTVIVSIIAVLLFSLAMLFWGFYTYPAHANFANLQTALIDSIGCLTSMVPQGLPVCVALALTIVARLMAARKVLVKNLSIIEAAGAMSILCSDKTGTLTQGKMFVQGVGLADHTFDAVQDMKQTDAVRLLLRIAYLCNDASYEESGDHGAAAAVNGGDRPVRGNSTDVAAFKLAAACADLDALDEAYTRVYNIPFNSKTKWMLVIVRSAATGDLELYMKGAPDILTGFCTKVVGADGTERPLTEALSTQFDRTQERWSRDGRRVIVACYKKLAVRDLHAHDEEFMKKFIETQLHDLCIVGLMSICDPPRDDVPSAVGAMRGAGVRVCMVTGDFRLTAEAIARQVGIVTSAQVEDLQAMRSQRDLYTRAGALSLPDMKPADGQAHRAVVLTGEDVCNLEPQDWNVIATFYDEIVFARTTPEQKMLIVQQFQRRGDNVVAVTGDGVNDAPALKTADVGLAMGAGSDVAKEAAQVVLLNNDFASIPIAIENGRLVFENLRKVTLYVMPAGSYTELMAVLSNVFLGMQIPLTAYQQVIFSIVHDVTMSISLMFEKPESDLMRQKPRNIRRQRLVDWKFFLHIYAFIGVFIWVTSFGMFFLYWKQKGLGISDLLLQFDHWGNGTNADVLNADLAVAQSIFYVTITVMQVGNILTSRNRRSSILNSNPFWGPRQNKALMVCVVVHVFVALMNVYVSTAPGNPNIFKFGYVPGVFWLYPIPCAIALILADEGRKYMVRNYPRSFFAKVAW